MKRTIAQRALVTTVAAATILLCALVPTAAHAEPTPSPTSPTPSALIKFRLPYLNGVHVDPNRLNLAEHAPKPAPLLLFLPATGARPENYTEFLRAATAQGFSVLALDYWNIGKSVTRTCLGNAECYTHLQQNRFTGSDPTPVSRVDAANSIRTRLRNALEFLDDHDPRGRWERYMNEATFHIDWSRIVLAGHSQGGGESAFISHLHRVRGVLMFSSPVESFQDVSASWMETPGKTSPARMYGLDSTNDVYYDRIVSSWEKLGMGTVDPKAATDVPIGSHVLLSSLYLGDPAESHDRTVGDATSQNTDGTPTLETSWKWMLAQVR